MIYHLKRSQVIHCSLEQAWEFFSSPRNLERLTPPTIGFKITHCNSDSMHEGQMIAYKVKVAPLVWVTWLTEIKHVKYPHTFIDDQRVGPYKVWHHTHRFEHHPDGVLMTDDVTYVMPMGIFGKLAHALFVRKKLKHIFDERMRLCNDIFNEGNASAT